MTADDEKVIDWSLCTFEGNQLRQDREFLAYSFAKKLEVVDDLGRFADEWLEKANARRTDPNKPVAG